MTIMVLNVDELHVVLNYKVAFSYVFFVNHICVYLAVLLSSPHALLAVASLLSVVFRLFVNVVGLLTALKYAT